MNAGVEKLYDPTLNALRALGGSATVPELETKTYELVYGETVTNKDHETHLDPDFVYQLRWARTQLKRMGLILNSTRGVWAITAAGADKLSHGDRAYEMPKSTSAKKRSAAEDNQEGWSSELLATMRSLEPSSFEVLCQRLLRESGFEKVEVTGRTGDGGIDGTGIMRIGGLLSFQVVFQCKRYSGSVPSKCVRDFRGAMSGRTDKGLLITTGKFTPDARAEATREGALPIDLVDGQELAEMLHSLKLGVRVESQEYVTVDTDWFASLGASIR